MPQLLTSPGSRPFALRVSPPRVLRGLLPLLALGALTVVATRAQTGVPSTRTVQLPDLNALETPPARVPIFYPPDPPAPGATLDRASHLQLPRWDAPAELVAFPGELFYPVLGTRIAEKELSKKLHERVTRYRTQRETLAGEIRARLKSSAPGDSAAACAALQAEAEQLRLDLALPEFNWNRYRGWSIATPVEKDEQPLLLARQFQLLRASVFYRDVFLPEQRALLHDFVLWFARSTAPATEIGAPQVGAGAVVPFLPAPSYIRLPNPLPRELALEFQAFLDAKHALQQEIVTALLTGDSQSASARERAFAALRKAHPARIDALEQQAEALRVKLAALPVAEPSPLPDDVVKLTREFTRRRDALENELIARLLPVRHERCRYKPGSEQLMWKSNFQSGAYVSVEAFRSPQELMAIVDETYGQQARGPATAEALQKAAQRFKTETATQQRELEALRTRLAVAAFRALFPDLPSDRPAPADTVARTLHRLQLEEIAQRMPDYADYVAATLRPGLSRAERRVLLQQALANFALPLPPGVRRPVFRLDAPRRRPIRRRPRR